MNMAEAVGRHELIARGIVMRGDSLLVNRGVNAKTGEIYFALPGGHIDPGESSRDAVRREVEEELQAKVAVGDLVFVSESVYPGRHADDGRRHEIVLYFEAELVGELSETDGRIDSPEPDKNFQWLPRGRFAEANILPRSFKAFLVNPAERPARYGYTDDTAPR